MNLYEVTNGYIGEAYVRVYVWAPNEGAALILARASFKTDGASYEPEWYTKIQARLLFVADMAPFATKPSDSGWQV